MNKIERLINLTAFLLDSNRPIALHELEDTVYRDEKPGSEALRRMFERDKEELRDMGIEVRAVKREYDDETGYTIDREEYYLPHLELTPQESVALTMVSRLFLGSGTPFSGPAHSALLKLAFDRDNRERGAERIPHIHWVEHPREREVLPEILEGLMNRKLLAFSYRSLDAAEPVEREVEPYGLFNRNGHWYLAGKCHLRGEIRCFKLDRMTSGVSVNRSASHTQDFEVPHEFDVETEARWEWPLPCEEEDVEARVLFTPLLAFAHATGRTRVVDSTRNSDGGFEVTYEVADPEQFVDWVLSFGTDAVILSPPELRAMARERLEGVLLAVGGGGAGAK